MRLLSRRRNEFIALWIVSTLALGADPSGCAIPAASIPAPAPEPVLSLSANGAMDSVVVQGWPLVLSVALAHPDAFDAVADEQPIVIGAQPTSWEQAVSLVITTETGGLVVWPLESAPPEPGNLGLDSDPVAALTSWLSPSSTASLAPGDYVVTARLDTRATAVPGAFAGVVEAVPVSVQIVTPPSPLAPEDEIRGLELLARFHALVGNPVAARLAADDLSLLHPESPRGFALLGDLDEADGAIAQALGHFSEALDAFYVANPDAEEPPSHLLARQRELRSRLLREAGGGGTPRISARTSGRGPGPTSDVVYVDLLISNTGDIAAVDTTLESVSPRVLTGTGSVRLDRTLSPSLPMHLPWLEPGGTTSVRLYFSLSPGVQRFAVAEHGVSQGDLGGDYQFSLSQAVLR